MPPTALICDDDPVLRGVVAEMVEAHGWRAAEVPTGRAAMAVASALQPDLVVMDVALTDMSGLAATPRIHADCPAARIVVLSSFDVPRQACLDAGAVDVLRKRELPRLDDLLARLERRRRAEEGLERLYDELYGTS